MMKKIVSAILSCLLYTLASSQQLTATDYINIYKDLAITEMKRSGIPASVTLAQGLLETENGNGSLVLKSNNHFGIKCKSSWTGSSVSHDDDAAGECFRKYEKAEDSYRDHSDYLRATPRYASLFNLEPTDYKGWCYGLKKAGYATNPRYPQILIRFIEKYDLQQYTLAGLKEATSPPEETNSDDQTMSASSSPKYDKNSYFNGLKAILVPAGSSLLAVATDMNIPLSRLMEYNDLDKDGILPSEQWLYLEKKPSEGKKDYCIAPSGSTLYSISQDYAVQLSSLMEYNHLDDPGSVTAGSRILLKRPIAAASSPSTGGSLTRTHEVKPKEGLFAISKKYNVTINDLKEWNGLTSDELRVGQQLIISK